jgi:hypothetical protein
LWKILRLGLPALRQAVAGGQYEYSNGLFFGGKEPAQSTKIVQNNFLKWSSASHIVHIDLHSDLGKYGRYKMLLTGETDNSKKEIYNHFFGSDHIELAEQGGTTAYKVTGDMGRWIAESTKEIDYHFLAAEFGTYSSVRVLGALRAENRAHFYAQEGSQIGRHAKSALLECFCPEDPSWRTSVVEQGVAILQQGQRLAHQLASGQT